MANEISTMLGLSFVKAESSLEVEAPSETIRFTMAGTRAKRGVQTIGTTHELFDWGDLTTKGWVEFVNLDPANFVEFGVVVAAAFQPVGVLLAGKGSAKFYNATGAALYLKADSAPCDVMCTAGEQ